MAIVGSPRASRGRGTRRRLSAALTIAVLASSAFAGAALAAAQSVTIDRTISSGATDLGGTTYIVSGVVSGNITVTATATLTQPIRETLAFDDGTLRQGASLPVHRSVAPNGAGNLHVVWHVTDTLPLIPGAFDTAADESCTLSFTGPVTCDVESDGFALTPDGTLTPGVPYADLVLQASVKVTPDDATVVSTELGGAVVVGGPATQTEPGTQTIDIPCTIGKGETLSISDADYSLATHINSTDGPGITVGVWLPAPIIVVPAFKSPGVTLDLGPQHAESFAHDFTDATTKVSALGPVAPNNVPPSADAGGPYTGKLEGVPVAFDASGSTSVCGFSSLALRWDFSDGGVAFGAHPFHTFTDDGTFSGLLTATDPTGLSNAVAFSVVVGNQDPAVNAGPDTTADWGRNVAFNGQATDPGAGDQSTLQYSWDFGDGSPSATGGPSVLHAYAAPGTYHTTLTVTDKDGGSDNDTRDVVVTKRDTITGYLGATAGTYDTPTSLSASLVDEYGANLNGKSIAFTVNGAAAGSGSTNSSGIATAAYTPLLAAGSYGTNAAFGGDALYIGSAGSGSIAIARKATTVTYTGALNGAPNKAIGLSAILADATGSRLAGRTIVFVLGAQTASAVTNASGVATTTLTLNQKNAIYPLTATFTPAGVDAGTYLGSSDAESFKLQKK
jgi:hypothetical protein